MIQAVTTLLDILTGMLLIWKEHRIWYKGRKSDAYKGMSIDFEESEDGINLTCISQEYSPKTVSNLGLKNPVCMYPVMLPEKWRITKFCSWGMNWLEQLFIVFLVIPSFAGFIWEDKPAVHLWPSFLTHKPPHCLFNGIWVQINSISIFLTSCWALHQMIY